MFIVEKLIVFRGTQVAKLTQNDISDLFEVKMSTLKCVLNEEVY